MDKILRLLDEIYKECNKKTVNVPKIRKRAIEASIYAQAIKNKLTTLNIDEKELTNDGGTKEKSGESE